MSDFSDPMGTSDDTLGEPHPGGMSSGGRGSGGLISSGSAPPPSRVTSAWTESSATQAEASAAAPTAPAPSTSVALSAVEARVLGSLIEKSFLTPDIYPMTTNAMATACNQKTNRDPVVDYSPVDIDSALMEMRGRNLVRRVHSQGSRSMKHRQTLDEVLALDERQLALVSVLLLRGAQTMGELRLRTERHDVGFDNLDAVEACLSSLASRTTPLVKELARQPGHKENRWQHLLGDGTQDAPVADSGAGQAPAGASSTGPDPTGSATAGLAARVEELESEVATLRRQLAGLADKLGEPLE